MKMNQRLISKKSIENRILCNKFVTILICSKPFTVSSNIVREGLFTLLFFDGGGF